MDYQERRRLDSLADEVFGKEVITLDDVRVVLDCIKQLAGDDEVAHSIEDQLHQAVLRMFANGVANASLAQTALLSLKIEFERWCA